MIEMHSFFNPPQNLNSLNYQAILILEWITSALFHLQYHDWGETPWARHRTPQLPNPGHLNNMAAHCPRCVFTTVCVHLDGLNAEHKFQVWVTTLVHTSLHFTLIYSFMPICSNHFTPGCFLNERQFKAGFVKKLKLKDGSLPEKREAGWEVLISM